MKFRELKQVRQSLAEARALLADPEMRAMAEEEITSLAPREPALEEEIKVLLLPKDPNDEKNVILEIRARHGRRRGLALCRRNLPHVPALRGATQVEDRAALII